jgi:hypothetical protein
MATNAVGFYTASSWDKSFMTLFKRLLRSWSRDAGKLYFEGRFLSIPRRHWFGAYAKSPNGRFTISWRDAADDNGQSGARNSGKGSFILLENSIVRAQGQLERPNDGKVANDGSFVLNDWHFTQGLNGTFYAFRADGSRILAQRFEANLYNNGIAPDGRLAVCQTANAPTEDGSVLAVFDLVEGVEIARWSPEPGWAAEYVFAGDGTIGLQYGDEAVFRYSADGDFIDRQLWLAWGLKSGVISVLHKISRWPEDEFTPALAARVLQATEVALANSHNSDWVLRLRGLCFEKLDSPADALACYEQALALNPKVGVKRRADALRKSLRNPT